MNAACPMPVPVSRLLPASDRKSPASFFSEDTGQYIHRSISKASPMHPELPSLILPDHSSSIQTVLLVSDLHRISLHRQLLTPQGRGLYRQ